MESSYHLRLGIAIPLLSCPYKGFVEVTEASCFHEQNLIEFWPIIKREMGVLIGKTRNK